MPKNNLSKTIQLWERDQITPTNKCMVVASTLTQRPRPTFHCKEVGDYIYGEGLRLGLETHRDAGAMSWSVNQPRKGWKISCVITLQAHMDMVPQKNSDVVHDFEKDPIDAYVEGEWVTARVNNPWG